MRFVAAFSIATALAACSAAQTEQGTTSPWAAKVGQREASHRYLLAEATWRVR